jgi:hypothetical protein
MNKVGVVRDKDPFFWVVLMMQHKSKENHLRTSKHFDATTFMVYLKTKIAFGLKINNPSLMIYMDSSWTRVFDIFNSYPYQVGIAKITLTKLITN